MTRSEIDALMRGVAEVLRPLIARVEALERRQAADAGAAAGAVREGLAPPDAPAPPATRASPGRRGRGERSMSDREGPGPRGWSNFCVCKTGQDR